jgi:hypothetical protein
VQRAFGHAEGAGWLAVTVGIGDPHGHAQSFGPFGVQAPEGRSWLPLGRALLTGRNGAHGCGP